MAIDLTKTKLQEDRRTTHIDMQEISDTVDRNSETLLIVKSHMKVLCDKLTAHDTAEVNQLAELRSDLKSVFAVMEDVAAVGRVGKMLKKVLQFATVIGAFSVAAWKWVEHFGDKP